MLSCSLGPNDGEEEEFPKIEATSCDEVRFLENGEDSSISSIDELQNARKREGEKVNILTEGRMKGESLHVRSVKHLWWVESMIYSHSSLIKSLDY